MEGAAPPGLVLGSSRQVAGTGRSRLVGRDVCGVVVVVLVGGRKVASGSSLVLRDVTGVVVVILLGQGDGEDEGIVRDGVGVPPGLVRRDIVGIIVVSEHAERTTIKIWRAICNNVTWKSIQ